MTMELASERIESVERKPEKKFSLLQRIYTWAENYGDRKAQQLRDEIKNGDYHSWL